MVYHAVVLLMKLLMFYAYILQDLYGIVWLMILPYYLYTYQVMQSPTGELVSRREPRKKHSLYWGYTVRVADSLSEVENTAISLLFMVASANN